MRQETHPIAERAGSSTAPRAFADRLADALDGEVRFDRLTRGIYSTDASIYQITPIGVAFPRSAGDVARAVEVAGASGVPLTARGAGTSMSGQSIGSGLILDTSRHLNAIRDFDPDARRIVVEPGIVLDDLNRFLAPHGLFFPIDVATSSRATIGGMAGNNSAGARSIRYGHMVEQVRGVEGVLADGRRAWFGPPPDPGTELDVPLPPMALSTALQSLYARESEELARRLPRVPRHVAGYALHRLGRPDATLADVLVGSEGTLAVFTAIELELHPIPAARMLGVCRFPTVRSALAAVPEIVNLEPTAVELVDRKLLELAHEIPSFRPALAHALGRTGSERNGGELELPGALLLVEFAGQKPGGLGLKLGDLEAVAHQEGGTGVLRAIDPELQAEVWGVRKAGLNIATSMKEPRKPIAFIEDCVIPIDRLAEWHDRLSEVIESHETEAIWYAHASVGCLHVRPALDLKDAEDVRRMRSIARDAFAIARDLGGSHSGEHGDGILRSEFLREMLGERLVGTFEEIKSRFDPGSVLNPGKIVHPPAMDDRSLFRYGPEYRPREGGEALDWSGWSGFAGAVEMCNNNGACRQRDPGVMCPSYRATEDERHSTRGRANALRLALSGQLGEDAWSSPELYEAMDLCIGCKACRRECPTGVDMARMKIEFLQRYRRTHPLTPRERVLANLPRLARWICRVPNFANTRNHAGPLGRLVDAKLGLASDRPLPKWASKPYVPPRRIAARKGRSPDGRSGRRGGRRVALFVDTFTRYFEPENARAAVRVLEAAGYRVEVPDGGRPVCCGRTFLNVGLVDEARAEMDRVVSQYVRYADGDIPIVGLEPSCLLTLRDELLAVRPGPGAEIVARQARLFSELIAEEALDRLPLSQPADGMPSAIVHGHCHEKAFGVDGRTIDVLEAVPELEVQTIRAGCCGMAGSFGYEAEHAELSRKIGETDLAPAVRDAPERSWIIANGTSCRHQIRDLTGREAVHLAVALDRVLRGDAD